MLNSGKEFQGQSSTRLTSLWEYSKKLRENSRGKAYQKSKQGNNRTDKLKKEKLQL